MNIPKLTDKIVAALNNPAKDPVIAICNLVAEAHQLGKKEGMREAAAIMTRHNGVPHVDVATVVEGIEQLAEDITL